MSRTRRLLRVVSWLAGGIVAILVLALVVSQTPWFRDWLRRTAMRQAERVLDGQLVIGRLEGTLFTGVTLTDVAVIQEGTPVVSIGKVQVTYGLGELLSDARVIGHLRIERPVIRAVRTATGWNLGRLLEPRPPGDPDAPRATFALPDITLVDGLVLVEAVGVEPNPAIPRRVEHLAFAGSVTSLGDALTVDVEELRFEATSPDLTVRSLTGRLVNERSGWTLDGLDVRTGASELHVDGTLTRAAGTDPLVFDLQVRAEPVSLPEIGRFVPAIADMDVAPTISATVDGTLDALRVDLDLDSSAGNATGPVTLDLEGPARQIAGELRLEDLNLAPWLARPEADGEITGRTTFDLRLPSETAGAPLDGTFTFTGAEAGAYGYAASNVTARGRIRGRRIELDARADAYGGAATTRGAITLPAGDGGAVVLSLAGRVIDVDLRRLPEGLQVPPLETSITAAYEVEGPLPTLRATVVLDPSTVEGVQLAEGFTATVTRRPDGYAFEASGPVAEANLVRLGRALDIEALQDERLDGVVNGVVHVTGVQEGDAPLALTASATLRDTEIYGGRVPMLTASAQTDGKRLRVDARGRVEGYDLPTLTDIPALEGTVGGEVDVRLVLDDLDDVRVETIGVDGTVVLEDPTLLGVPFDRVEAAVALENGVLDVRQLTGTGDDFTLTGQGAIALGEQGTSDFSYRLDADSLVDPAQVADLPITGQAVTEGRITGPREDFTVSGTLEGSSLAYDDAIQTASLRAQYVVALPDLDADRLRVAAEITAGETTAAGVPLQRVEGTVGYVPGVVTFDLVAQDELRTLRAEGDLALGDEEQRLMLETLSIEREDVRWVLAPPTAPTDAPLEAAVEAAPSTAPGVATVVIRPDALEIAPLSLVSGAQAIEVAGRVALAPEATHAIEIEARAVDIGEALSLAGQDVDADGTLALSARVAGTGTLPTVEGQLEVTDARYRGLPIAEVRATIEDDNGAALVDVLVRQSDRAYLTAKGRVPRTLFLPPDTKDVPASADDTLDLTVRSTSIDLGLAEGLTDQVTELQGQAQLDLRLTNTGRTPVVNGEVTLVDAGFLVTETGVRYSDLNAAIDFAADHAEIRQLTVASSNGQTLAASGEIGLRNTRKGDVKLQVEGDGFRVLDNDLGTVDLDADLTVTGTIYAPVVEGDVTVANGRLALDELLPRFASGTYDTKASYQGIPTYAPADAPPVVPDILSPEALKAEIIYAVPPERAAFPDEAVPPGRAGRRVVVSAPQPTTGPDAGGRAAPTGGQANAQAGAPQAGAESADAAAADAPTFVYEDMAINVRVRIPDNLVLRGQNVEAAGTGIGDVNITLGGDFRVAKPSGEPLVLIGAVNTVRGTYAYQGRQFDIARDGQILFRGDGTTNPSLDITAERVIQGVEARVRIQGTAEEPRLSLSSTPPLDEADVLALIVFNQPLNQLGTGQQNSLAQRATGIAAGLAISPIAQALGNTLDLDVFDVETTDQTGRVNPAVVIGEQVNQNLFVKFRQQFGNQQVSQFLLEYRLAEFLRLQANAAEGDGLSRGNRSIAQRIERYGADLVFYFAF